MSSAATYVSAAAASTLRAPLSSPPVNIAFALRIFSALEDASNSTGNVISWNKRLNLQEKNKITNQQTIDNIKVKYWSK